MPAGEATVLIAARDAWLVHLADPQGLAPRPAVELPWPEAGALLALAGLHGVLPAVLRGLARQPEAPAYAETLRAGRERLALVTGFSMMLNHHAGLVVSVMRDAGIGGEIVKGATFARRIYSEPVLRSFTDIDLLVDPADRERAGEMLAALGFRAEEVAYRAGQDYGEDKWILASHPGVMVELHTNLVHHPKLRRGMRLDHAALLAAGAGDAEDAAALLLVAAVHGAGSHQFDRLQHVVDVLLLARGGAGDIAVDRLREAARRCDAGLALAAALGIAGRMFGEPRCLELARALGVSRAARLSALLISPGVVLRAQGAGRSADSWRRKLLRQMLRLRQPFRR